MPLHVTRAVAVNLFCHMESRHKLLLILWTGDMQGKGDGQTASPLCILHGALHTLQRDPSAGVKWWCSLCPCLCGSGKLGGRAGEGFQLTNRERYTVLLHIISMLFVTSFLTPVRSIVTDEEPNCYCLLCY